MSDHQFQEREYEAAGHPERMDLMDLLMGGIDIPTSGALSHQQIQELSNSLPRLTEQDLVKLGHGGRHSDMVHLRAAHAQSPQAMTPHAMDSPAHAFEEMGVTRVWFADRDEGKRGCGHVFCRRCLSKWIGGGHDTCPSCRHALLPESTPNAAAASPANATSASPSNAEEEAALRQFQEQMRSLRTVLESTSAQNPDFERQFSQMFGAQGVFGRPQAGTSAARDDDRSDFSGMYS
ncbi:hypothetical protein FIBSPDRAFT_943868 [Athelia psychrophila]|uniref:RING-type domain-containing protein n=1 Tax=Athelia psychrophila TaxID=1759441 RepID=A0A166VN19_9AGAM|nr:hypothetical protein FIBSPDRAFT_943868 [Fibularhizoctonia sp. CBS 109695]